MTAGGEPRRHTTREQRAGTFGDHAPPGGGPDSDPVRALLMHREVEAFLVDEAQLLDEWRLEEWLELVTDDVVYQVPVRTNKEVTDGTRVTGVQTNAFHMDENRQSLQLRVDRIGTGFAWAEEPPTRTRHVIGNVRVHARRGRAEVAVRSNVLLYHTRWDRPEYHVLSCERHDVLRRVDGRLRLARRLAVLDNTVIPTLSISFLL